MKSLRAGLVVLLSACGSTEPPPVDQPEEPGGDIVFQTWSNEPDIYVVNADGSGLTRLTDFAGEDRSPSWSGDGRRIYFVSYNREGTGAYALYAMNPDGSDVTPVLPNLGYQPYDISPDGTRIALGVRGASPPEMIPQSDLYVMNIDGTGRTRVVDLPIANCDEGFFDCPDIASVAWSPDGQRIAYTTVQTGRALSVWSYIGVVNADGTGDRFITGYGRHLGPDWSPDGRRLVFASGDDSSIPAPMDLEIMNADGTGRTVLLDGDADGMVNSGPSWSPDGTSIVFSRYPEGDPANSELYVIDADGTNLRRLTGVAGGAVGADWGPATR